MTLSRRAFLLSSAAAVAAPALPLPAAGASMTYPIYGIDFAATPSRTTIHYPRIDETGAIVWDVWELEDDQLPPDDRRIDRDGEDAGG